MTGVQRFLVRVLPRSWGQRMEADSRMWRVQCPCGFERSVWEAGGVRWLAKGEPLRLVRCPACGQARMHRLYKGAPAAAVDTLD